MDLINKQVTHKIFGQGRVVQCDDSYVQIDFPLGNKKFVFPDAFGTYLTLVDQGAAAFVEKMVEQKKKKCAAEEQKMMQFRALQSKERQRLLEQEKLAKRSRIRRINPCSQAVFWCTQEELDTVFTDWNIFTGAVKSGRKAGRAKRLAQIGQNSACLLTVRNADQPEKERRISGAFMLNELFIARRCTDGYIPAHSEHRLRLSDEESKKMLFWNYYVNKRCPHRMTWNTGRQRYFDNEWMAQILRDLVSLKSAPREQEQVQRFFDYFCQMNRIDQEKLPQPGGALLLV